jgi:VWFA-related protein
MGPGDLMLVAPFSKTIGATTGPTDDRRTILEAIGAIQPTGGTAILDAITRIGPALATAKGRRAIVLITDGYDEQSTATIDDAIAAVKAADATVYVIGIGGVAGISLKGERLLKRLAAETGGKCFLPSTARELASVRDRLTDDVQHRYLVTYTPSNQAVDGTWRTLSVSTAVPGATVRTRNGYFAPRPAPIRPMLEFTAIDGAGRYVNLTADDLEILEDGEPQDVQIFQDAVEPVSIVLALDASGSMRRKEPDVIRSAQGFVDALRPEDRLAVVTFSDTPVFAHDLSTTREFSRAAIEKYSAAGGTALYDAMTDGLLRLKHTEGRRVVVVMTDGRDENNPGTGPGSVHTLADVLKLQKESGAMIFTIGLGTKVDHQVLTQFAKVSGCRALFPLDVQALDTEYRRVIEDLRRRYVVGFTSTHTTHDGAWRDVQIRVKSDPEATIRGAGGYFAPNK